MDTKIADRILEKTRADYEAIAGAFTDSRTELWEEEHYFGQYIKDNLAVLDLGCANGRLLKLFEKHKVAYTGADSSVTMLKSAEHYAKVFPTITASFIRTDLLSLPFTEVAFDIVFCIATLHHIPSAEYQLQAVKEMFRVLRPGGLLLMSNWDLASQSRYVKKNDRLRGEHPELFDGFGEHDFLITWRWQLLGKTIYRYYHSFTKEELSDLLSRAGFTRASQKTSDGASNIEGRVKRNSITIASKPA